MNTCYITSAYPYRGSFKLVQACSIFLDSYTRSLELVHACSIFLRPIYQVLGISTLLFYFLGHIYQVLKIRTRLFYFLRHIYQVPRISTRLFYFLGHIYQILRISTRQKGYSLFENDFGLSLMLSCAMVFQPISQLNLDRKRQTPPENDFGLRVAQQRIIFRRGLSTLCSFNY